MSIDTYANSNPPGFRQCESKTDTKRAGQMHYLDLRWRRHCIGVIGEIDISVLWHDLISQVIKVWFKTPVTLSVVFIIYIVRWIIDMLGVGQCSSYAGNIHFRKTTNNTITSGTERVARSYSRHSQRPAQDLSSIRPSVQEAVHISETFFKVIRLHLRRVFNPSLRLSRHSSIYSVQS